MWDQIVQSEQSHVVPGDVVAIRTVVSVGKQPCVFSMIGWHLFVRKRMLNSSLNFMIIYVAKTETNIITSSEYRVKYLFTC